jgi:hypothetical protein
VQAFLAPAKKRTFLSTSVYGLIARSMTVGPGAGDIYIQGFDGSVLGSQTIIQFGCCAHAYTHTHTEAEREREREREREKEREKERQTERERERRRERERASERCGVGRMCQCCAVN